MTFDWQNCVAISLVALAMAYLGQHLYRRLTKKSAGGCGGCGSCPTGEKVGSGMPLVSIGDLSTNRPPHANS